MKDTTIAVDIAKDVFEIAVSPEPGVVSEKHRVSRKKRLSFFANRPAATVVMEACGSSHHWGREINKLGHGRLQQFGDLARFHPSRGFRDFPALGDGDPMEPGPPSPYAPGSVLKKLGKTLPFSGRPVPSEATSPQPPS